MLTEFGGDEVTGGTFPAIIWRTFILSADKILAERKAAEARGDKSGEATIPVDGSAPVPETGTEQPTTGTAPTTTGPTPEPVQTTPKAPKQPATKEPSTPKPTPAPTPSPTPAPPATGNQGAGSGDSGDATGGAGAP